MLSDRLTLAASMYEPCALGADIGTDHGLLPCFLLEKEICGRMLLCDVSPKAIRHAEDEVRRRGLEDRAEVICAPGLDAIGERICSCVSITGMGGETMAGILLSGAEKLRGAVLVLSPQTEHALVRKALSDISYRPEREELCRDAGRFYQVWRCIPGSWEPDEEELRYGSLLFRKRTPALEAFAAHKIRVLEKALKGLRSAGERDEHSLSEAEKELSFYRQWLDHKA